MTDEINKDMPVSAQPNISSARRRLQEIEDVLESVEDLPEWKGDVLDSQVLEWLKSMIADIKGHL